MFEEPRAVISPAPVQRMPPRVVQPARGAEPLRVLQLLSDATDNRASVWLERLVQGLAQTRFTTLVLCASESALAERLRQLGLEVVIAAMPDNPSWSSIQTVSNLINTRGIELLHAHQPQAHLLAGLAGRLTGKPVLATIHSRQLTPLDLEVHRAAGSHLSVLCRETYSHASGLGVAGAWLSLQPDGVDIKLFRPRPRHSEDGLRHELGLAEDTPLVGFVGRLSPDKGPDVFVHAALLLRQLCPQAHAVIVGDGEMREPLGALIDECELGDRLHLLGQRNDTPAIFNQLDVLVSSAHSASLPLALMEAMASGVPVVATRVGGVPEMVVPGQTGWLVGRGDFEALARRSAALLADPEARREMGQRARQRAVARMNLGDSIERVARLLARLALPRQIRQPDLALSA